MSRTAVLRKADILILTIVALCIRLVWVRWGTWETPDGAEYLQLARNLARYGTFGVDGMVPTCFRAPLYPALISLLWTVSRAPVSNVLLLQAVLGAATAGMTYQIAHDRWNRSVALTAGVLFAVAPMSSRYVATVLTETLFTFLVTLGVLCWGRGRHIATGVAFGLAALTRPALLPFILLLCPMALVSSLRSRLGIHRIVLSALAVLSFWTVRNAVLFSRLVPVAEGGWGLSLFLGTIPIHLGANPFVQVDPEWSALDKAIGKDGPSADSMVKERAAMRLGLERIRHSPLQWIEARATQYPRLFIDTGEYLLPADGQAAWKAGRPLVIVTKTGFALGNLAVVLFALLGLYAARWRLLSIAHIWLFPVYLTAVYVPMWIESRYGLPMMPMMFVLAAAVAAAIAQRFGGGWLLIGSHDAL